MPPELTQTQSMRQAQHLSLQQAQAVKALQLPALALRQFIKNELDTNPFLEEVQEVQEVSEVREESRKDDRLAEQEEWDDDYREDNPELEERRQFAYDSIGARETLYDDLSKQLDYLTLPPARRALAMEITGSLDTSGYLRTPLAEIAQAIPNATVADAEEALAAVQSLEPAGVGARDLAECLLLQLARNGLADTLAADILRGDPALLEKRNFTRIAEAQNATPAEVGFAFAEIQKLDPTPGANFAPREPEYVEPEIQVFKNPATGKWDVALYSLADLDIPKLGVADTSAYDSNAKITKGERDYIARRRSDARAIVHALEERQKTILLVSRETVARQQAYFDTGEKASIAPLTMMQIAEVVRMNESTVTRAVSGKYGNGPRGIFELRSLFTTAGVATAGGGSVTDLAVKEKIKTLIGAEDPAAPLADQDIAEMLVGEGINISRRTVAKYREAVGIASSRERKGV